ncbi:MAG: hypothetical protein NTZ05_23455, partial [Chloroflexi bacterium]|nr:hypothetical protein [Chloroflexota bacterium]
MLRRVVARKWAVLAVLALAVIGVVFAQRQSDGGGLLGTTSTTAGNYINRISIRMTGAGTTSLSVTPADGSDGKYTNSTSGALNCLYGYGISAASSSVRVTAAPAAGYRFSGWGSYTPANAGEGSVVCSGTTANPCTVNAGAWPILVPNFVPLTAPTATPAPSGPLFLNVTGLGTVTSAPAGVNCTGTANGTNCNPNLNPGTSYTLTAAPAAGQVFKGWTLKCTGTTLTFTFNFVNDDVVTAAFGPAPTLSLTVVSYGWVDVSPGGEKCIGLPTGRNCPLPLTPGVSYTLKATPAADMAFAGWGGNRCTGAATTCTFAFAVNDTVTASFQPQGKLTVALTRPSTGYISLTGANNLAAKCGKGADGVDSSQCSVQVFPGDSVILTRTVQSPDPAFAFDSWAITPAPATPCSTTSAVCTVFVNSNTTIAAKFKLVSALNIVSAPPGAPYTPSCPANY